VMIWWWRQSGDVRLGTGVVLLGGGGGIPAVVMMAVWWRCMWGRAGGFGVPVLLSVDFGCPVVKAVRCWLWCQSGAVCVCGGGGLVVVLAADWWQFAGNCRRLVVVVVWGIMWLCCQQRYHRGGSDGSLVVGWLWTSPCGFRCGLAVLVVAV
jgi:hypothetical protein